VRPSSSACRDDLFARSRRAPLSAVERRALDAHLGVCDLCQAARAFASLYDGVADRPAAEDDALIARLADRVAGGRPAVRRRRRATAFAVAAGAALLIAAGGAAAWVSSRRPPAESSASHGAPRPAAARIAAGRVTAPARPLSGDTRFDEAPPDQGLSGEAPPRHDATVVTAPPGRRRARADHREPADTAPADAPATAADLFAAANAARRARDLRGAVDRYLALERRFPDSEEALVSLVTAADILSRLGEPEAALGAFDRYLARRPEGALAPEALFGRARSIQRLGRRADEVAAWRRLLRAFPGSIYEAAARHRLDELSR
jgi:TolA-binding protein